jgi:hypothetical protein
VEFHRRGAMDVRFLQGTSFDIPCPYGRRGSSTLDIGVLSCYACQPTAVMQAFRVGGVGGACEGGKVKKRKQ